MSSEASTEERQTPNLSSKEEPKFLTLSANVALRVIAGIMFCLGIVWITSNSALGEFSIIEALFSVLLMLVYLYLYIATYLKSPHHLGICSIVLSMMVLAWTVVEAVAYATFDWEMQAALTNAESGRIVTVEEIKAGPIAAVVIAIIINLGATGLSIFLARSYRHWLLSI